MPGTSSIEMACEKCKKMFETDVIDHIDLSEDAELIKSLKTGKVNRVQCPKCKKVMYLDRSVVVNFEPQDLIVIFDTKAKTKSAQELLKQEYDSVISYNEIFVELGATVEFKVISNLVEFKKLLADHAKQFG
ncbi:MAG: CpXC domain-containing protein [Candidatus Thorarchaeota archaeon]